MAEATTIPEQVFLVTDKQAHSMWSDSKASVDRNSKLERDILGNYKLGQGMLGNYKLGDRRKWSVELAWQDKRNYLSSR